MSQGHTYTHPGAQSTTADWPLRGWHRRTLPSLLPCCQRIQQPPSLARRQVPASLACKLLLLLSRRDPLISLTNPLKNAFWRLHFTWHMGSWLDPRPKQYWFCASGHRHDDVCPPHRLLHRAESLHRTWDRLAEHVHSLSRAAPHAYLIETTRQELKYREQWHLNKAEPRMEFGAKTNYRSEKLYTWPGRCQRT